MTRHWAPFDGPQRAMMHLRARRDGRARSAFDLELPLMALLAVLVGIGVVIWLNGQGAPDSGEIRRVTERPQLAHPRATLAAAQARREAEARALARQRRARAARRAAAERRAALAAATARRPYSEDERFQNGSFQNGNGYPVSGTQGLSTSGETYTQQQVRPTPAPRPAPKPAPKRTGGGGGGSGGQFDDSG